MDQLSELDAPPVPAGLGHNNPPGPLPPAQVRESLLSTHAPLLARRDQLLAGITAFIAKYPTITTEDVAAAATENLNMARKWAGMCEEQRKEAKEPYLEGGRAVDLWFKAAKSVLDPVAAKLHAQAEAYATAQAAIRRQAAMEAAAAAAAEAEQRAAEAAAAAAAAAPAAEALFDTAIEAARQAEAAEEHATAKAAVHSRVVGTYGSTSSLRERWEVEVVDPDQVPRAYLVVDMAAVRRAVAQGTRTIPGCRIYAATKLAVR